MVSKTVLAALAVSGVSAIELFPGHQGARRELQARQTEAGTDYWDYTDCATALIPIYDTLPSLPADVISYEITATYPADACEPTYPAHISSELKVYETEVLRWYSSNSAAIESALSECPQYSSDFTNSLDTTPSYYDACASATLGGGGDATATASAASDTASAATASDEISIPSSEATTPAGKTTEATTPTGKTSVATTPAGKTTAATEPTTPAGNTASPTTTASANAGPRETAYLGAAVAAAVGFLGLAMAL